jgi:hypothetical protein
MERIHNTQGLMSRESTHNKKRNYIAMFYYSLDGNPASRLILIVFIMTMFSGEREGIAMNFVTVSFFICK